METITIPKNEFELIKKEIKTLRNTKLYKKLFEFETNIKTSGKFTRKDLGF